MTGYTVLLLAIFLHCTAAVKMMHRNGGLRGNLDFAEYKVLDFTTELVLHCNQTIPSTNLTLKWLKDGEPFLCGENITCTEHSLVFMSPKPEDVANYTCVLINKYTPNNVIGKVDFIVVAKPYVKLPGTVTVIEGEQLVLECIVIGTPSPIVVWEIGRKTYEESEDRVTLMDAKGVKNAVMYLDSVQLIDSGDYSCTAYNVATTIVDPMKDTVIVRVERRSFFQNIKKALIEMWG